MKPSHLNREGKGADPNNLKSRACKTKGKKKKKYCGRRKWQPTPVFFSGESHDRGAWQAIVCGVARV